MPKLLLFLAFVIVVIVGAGQPASPADSLLRVLSQHPAKDSIRVTALLGLSDATVYTDPAGAMREADEALAISEASQWIKGLALSWRQKGNAYYVFSDNPAALDAYVKALTIARPLHIRELDASLFNNLANIYSDQRQYEKALDFYRQFLQSAKEQGSAKEETIALVNMGTVYTELNQLEKALECGRQALAICRSHGIAYYIPIVLNNLGVAYDKTGKSDSALGLFRQSIAGAESSGNYDAAASSLEEMAKVYTARGDLSNTEKFARQSLALARKVQSAEWQAGAWQSLFQVYEKRGQPAQALAAYKQYILFRDSVSNSEKQSTLTKKVMQFDFERKEAATKAENDKNAALAQAEIRRQQLIRNSLTAGVVLLLLAGLSSFLLYKRRRDADERRAKADLKARVLETEMTVLRLQMNPHFIFNSLNSISDYIAKNETVTANYFLSKFAKMMRLVLEHSEKAEITLAEDMQVLETYIQLEGLRLKNDLRYVISIDPDIDPETTLVPPLIVQPFVENSIWHGLSGKTGGGMITIRITREAGMIHYTVEDNGIGRAAAARNTATGKRSMGLQITRDRLDMLNKTKGTSSSVEITDLSPGTRVELSLPFQLND